MHALAAVEWHFWIAVPLVIVSIIAVLATFAGYLKKVVAPKYPRR